MGRTSLRQGVTATVISLSATANSLRKIFSIFWQISVVFSASATVKTALAATGMALSLPPPESVTRRPPFSCKNAYRIRPSSTMALARPRSMAAPEWPPKRPETVISTVSPGKASRFTGTAISTLAAPAHPAVISPSVSESRFKSRRLLKARTGRCRWHPSSRPPRPP